MAARPLAGKGAEAPAAAVKVRWSRRALRDVEEIYAYVAADKPEAARKLAGKLMLAGHELMHHPNLGRLAREGGLRELVVGNYVLVYRVTDVLDIVTVVHGARKQRV